MAAEHKITTIHLPDAAVASSAGFSVDIGGSMAKIIYRSNKLYKNGKRVGERDPECPEGMGVLCCIQFPRADTDEYCAFLRDNCDIIQGATVHATGVGGSQYMDKLEGLGVKINMRSEFECFSRSLNLMIGQFVKNDWLQPLNERGMNHGLEALKAKKLMKDMTAGRPLMTEEEFQKDYVDRVAAFVKRSEEERKHLAGVQYPYLMVLCGSAFGFLKVNKDGSAEMVDFSMLSGRFFLGMSAVLTGEKDYDSLIKMCEDFDGSSIDVLGRDLKSAKADEQENLYSKIPDNSRVFDYGKGYDVDPDTVKKGDLVSSLNQTICETLALSVFHLCQESGLRHVYFCGGFVSQEITRRYITSGLTSRLLLVPSEKRFYFDFVSNSSHLGSLGAFLGDTKE